MLLRQGICHFVCTHAPALCADFEIPAQLQWTRNCAAQLSPQRVLVPFQEGLGQHDFSNHRGVSGEGIYKSVISTSSGRTWKIITKLDGDQRTVCAAPTGKPFPTKFTSKGHRLTVFKRVKTGDGRK